MQTIRTTDIPVRYTASNTAQTDERAQIYILLARLMHAPPDSSLINSIIEIDDSQLTLNRELNPALRELQAAARLITSTDALDDEYHELFIGIGRGELTPYASWYLTGFLMERPLAELRDTLSSLGLERQPGVHEPEDHISALLETMALIIYDTSDNRCIQQAAFFEKHMAPWVSRFFTDLQQSQAANFYRRVAKLAEQFMRFESEFLEHMEKVQALN